MTCNPGHLVLIPLPYADLSATKKRPVLALTAPDRHGDFIGRPSQYGLGLRRVLWPDSRSRNTMVAAGGSMS